jgi:hypothetical protein
MLYSASELALAEIGDTATVVIRHEYADKLYDYPKMRRAMAPATVADLKIPHKSILLSWVYSCCEST